MPTLAQQWFEKGREEGIHTGEKQGQAALLIRLLERRFGALPKVYRERITAADPQTLLVWGKRVLTAQRLDEVFEDPAD